MTSLVGALFTLEKTLIMSLVESLPITEFVAVPSAFSDYRDFLRAYIDHRKTRGRQWSYAVWARQLGLRSPSGLVMIVNGQRHPGPKLVRKLTEHFKLSRIESEFLSDLIEIQKAQKSARRCMSLIDRVQGRLPSIAVRVMDEQRFGMISHWYNYAIRELVNLKDFREDLRWICRRLGTTVPKNVIRDSIYQLLDFGLLSRNRQGKLIYSGGHVRSTDDVRTDGLRMYHGQILDLAKESIESVSVDVREVSGGCFAVSNKSLPRAKELIRKFQQDICELLEDKAGDEVYQLEVAFFPLTNRESQISHTGSKKDCRAIH